MTKENINFPPYAEVREIKNETPSFEEFMKTYEYDDKIARSYEDELEAKAVQGSQYGPKVKVILREFVERLKMR